MKHYDVIVIGLGIMGAAAGWRSAQAGLTVLGIEAGGPTHSDGSSHGATRIFRSAYQEGATYLPLLDLARHGWTELQAASGKRLMSPTGGLFIGPRHTGLVSGSLRTALAGGIDHEHWNAAELRRRMPQFAVEDNMHAIFEPGAFAIAAEDARLQMLNQSVRHGAALRYGCEVTTLENSGDDVVVGTRSGERFIAGRVIVTTGPWMARRLLPELAAQIVPHRIPIYWFAPRAGQEPRFDGERLPVFAYECNDGALLYGIPAGVSAERGVKIGFHNRQLRPADACTVAPELDDALRGEMAGYATRILPGLDAQPADAKWCFYTMSKDESFVIGDSRALKGVHYASVCSGHGFKFAPAIGKVLAALAQGQATPVDIRQFSVERFGEQV
jgi:sarcosine oxidase